MTVIDSARATQDGIHPRDEVQVEEEACPMNSPGSKSWFPQAQLGEWKELGGPRPMPGHSLGAQLPVSTVEIQQLPRLPQGR